MTIAAGFVANDGILLCTDTQYTASEKTYREKMFSDICGAFRVTFALAGDEDYAKTAIQDAFTAISSLSGSNAGILDVKAAIREVIKSVMADYEETKRDPYQRPQFLISLSSRNHQELLVSRDTALYSIPTYLCLGSGSYLAQYLIDQVLPANPIFYSIRSLIPVTLHAMAAAKRYDSSCGGGSHFMAIRGHESRAVRFLEAASSDEVFREFDRLASQLMFYLNNTEPSNLSFEQRLSTFTQDITSLRERILAPESQFSKLLNALSPISPQYAGSTTDDPLSQQPSQE